ADDDRRRQHHPALDPAQEPRSPYEHPRAGPRRRLDHARENILSQASPSRSKKLISQSSASSTPSTRTSPKRSVSRTIVCPLGSTIWQRTPPIPWSSSPTSWTSIQ